MSLIQIKETGNMIANPTTIEYKDNYFDLFVGICVIEDSAIK